MAGIFHTRDHSDEGSATPALARRLNLYRTLDLLRRESPLTRAEITRRRGFSAPTASKLLDVLERLGLVRELKTVAEGRGRPSRRYELSDRRTQVFGVVIGVRACRIFTASLALDLRKTGELAFGTPGDYAGLLAKLRKFIDARRADPDVEYLGLGMSAPGLIDTREQRILVSPNIHYLDGAAPALDLTRDLGLRTVTLQEEHALCLAEQTAGNTGDLRDYVMLDVSEGVGTGIVLNGEHIGGCRGFAGEIGHLPVVPDGLPCGCGRRGCLETVASDKSLLRRMAARIGSDSLDLAQADRLLRDNEARFAADLDETARFLALGLTALINLLNPGLILLNGGMFNLPGDMLGRVKDWTLKQALAPSAAVCELKLVSTDRDSGVLAGISDALLASIGDGDAEKLRR